MAGGKEHVNHFCNEWQWMRERQSSRLPKNLLVAPHRPAKTERTDTLGRERLDKRPDAYFSSCLTRISHRFV